MKQENTKIKESMIEAHVGRIDEAKKVAVTIPNLYPQLQLEAKILNAKVMPGDGVTLYNRGGEWEIYSVRTKKSLTAIDINHENLMKSKNK